MALSLISLNLITKTTFPDKMATFQNHCKESKSKMKTNDLRNLCFRNPVQFDELKCSICSSDSYCDKMLESADTPLSISVPIQSLDNNLSATDCLASLSNALSTHTAIADHNDFFSNCNYYSVQELNNKLSNSKDSELFLIHVNIRSIQKILTI